MHWLKTLKGLNQFTLQQPEEALVPDLAPDVGLFDRNEGLNEAKTNLFCSMIW